MGSNAIYFDQEAMAVLKHSTSGYHSTWRILHIDKFEKKSWFEEMAERRLIPACEPTKFRFFSYAQPVQGSGRPGSTFDRGVRRSNQGRCEGAEVWVGLDQSVVAL